MSIDVISLGIAMEWNGWMDIFFWKGQGKQEIGIDEWDGSIFGIFRKLKFREMFFRIL